MLTKDEYNALPEKAKNAFTLDGEQYVPVKDAKLKSTLDDLDGKFKTAEQRAKELEQRLASFEEAKKAELAAEREKALEEARTKGDVKAIEERYQQQVADVERQTAERVRAEVLKEVAAEKAKDRKAALIAELSMIGVDEDAREAVAFLLVSHVDVDPETGKEFYLDENGGAMAVDKKGAIEAFKKMRKFRRLVDSGVTTKGTPNATGSGGGGAAQRKFDEYTGAELSALLKENPAEYERLKSERNK